MNKRTLSTFFASLVLMLECGAAFAANFECNDGVNGFFFEDQPSKYLIRFSGRLMQDSALGGALGKSGPEKYSIEIAVPVPDRIVAGGRPVCQRPSEAPFLFACRSAHVSDKAKLKNLDTGVEQEFSVSYYINASTQTLDQERLNDEGTVTRESVVHFAYNFSIVDLGKPIPSTLINGVLNVAQSACKTDPPAAAPR